MAEKTTWAYTPKRQGDRVALPHGQSHVFSFLLTVTAALQSEWMSIAISTASRVRPSRSAGRERERRVSAGA